MASQNTVFGAQQMAAMCDLLISHLTGVVPLLDELDELYGGDGDSGSNTLRSLTAVRQAVRRACDAGIEADLDTWASAARTVGIGHTGMLTAVVFSALSKYAHAGVLRPVELRQFCLQLGADLAAAFTQFTPAATITQSVATNPPAAGADQGTAGNTSPHTRQPGQSGRHRARVNTHQGPDLFEGLLLFLENLDLQPQGSTESAADSQPGHPQAEATPSQEPAPGSKPTPSKQGETGPQVSLSPGLELITAALARTATDVEEPITHPHLLIGEATMEVLSDIASSDSLPDAGACVLAILIAALHATYENDAASLPPTIDMIRALWEGGAQAPTELPPATKTDPEAVSVDILVDGFADEIASYLKQLEDTAHAHSRPIRLARVGTTDAFGMQSWRFRIDTTQPELALPGSGWTRLAAFKDSRATDSIGFDELALREAAAGIVFLTRPTTQRAATARVLICLDDPAWIREAVATGAHVLYRPTSPNATVVAELLASAPAGVSVVVAPDETAFDVIRRAHALATAAGSPARDASALATAAGISAPDASTPAPDAGAPAPDRAKHLTVVEVCAESQLAAIMAGRECARIFMPALAHRNQQIAADMLRTRAREATARLQDFSPEDVDAGALVRELTSPHVARVVLFAPTRSHPFAEQVFAQLAGSDWPGTAEFFASDQLRVSLVEAGEG